MQSSIKALYNQAAFAVEVGPLRCGHWQAIGAEQLAAEPLIVDRGAEINLSLTDHSHRQLEEMGCGRAPQRQTPFVVVQQEGCFLLSTGNREPELIRFRAQRSWNRRRRYGAQALADFLVAQRPSLDAIDVAGHLVWRKQLHGSGTVAADGSQQIEGTGAGCPKPSLGSTANGVAVGKEIVKPALDGMSAERRAPEPCRQRQR